MSKGQKRMAAIFLALMGILGTMMAQEDRMKMMEEQAAQTTETVTEASTAAD